MAVNESPGFSVVEYFSDHSGYRCGYCKSKDTNYSHGMWAHKMKTEDYQDLIDRGWRRSGKYCYKPTLNKTCCPQYTIKCDALNFKLSKSQKKVLKRMHAYLSHGNVKKFPAKTEDNDEEMHESENVEMKQVSKRDLSNINISMSKTKEREEFQVPHKTPVCAEEVSTQEGESRGKHKSESQASDTIKTQTFKPGIGRDASKPACKKAKVLRRERRAAKLASAGGAGTDAQPKKHSTNEPKSLEDYLNAPLPDNPAHRLEVRLILALPVDPDYVATLETSHSVFKKYQMNIHREPEMKCVRAKYERFLCNSSLQFRLVPVSYRESKFVSTFKASYAVFRNYQMTIHQDPPDECSESSFKNFLVDGPLTAWKPANGPPNGYGPFHHQYWLDGQLIAVGVVDILPNSVSSVYLYYDPEFAFLSLGTYSSLREILLTRELHRYTSQLKWYYMGFYIHSCPKMRYKGNYSQSYLLCPETFTWEPIEKCSAKLDVNKYCRFNEDLTAKDRECDIDTVMCLYKGSAIPYIFLRATNKDEDEVKEYSSLVGPKAATSLLLYRE